MKSVVGFGFGVRVRARFRARARVTVRVGVWVWVRVRAEVKVRVRVRFGTGWRTSRGAKRWRRARKLTMPCTIRQTASGISPRQFGDITLATRKDIPDFFWERSPARPRGDIRPGCSGDVSPITG